MLRSATNVIVDTMALVVIAADSAMMEWTSVGALGAKTAIAW